MYSCTDYEGMLLVIILNRVLVTGIWIGVLNLSP